MQLKSYLEQKRFKNAKNLFSGRFHRLLIETQRALIYRCGNSSLGSKTISLVNRRTIVYVVKTTVALSSIVYSDRFD